jgi:hypothetical protein
MIRGQVMRIRLLRNTIVDLKQVSVGDIVETSEKSALLLIGIGKAELAPILQEVVVTADEQPDPVQSKPTPKRRKTNDPQPRVEDHPDSPA